MIYRFIFCFLILTKSGFATLGPFQVKQGHVLRAGVALVKDYDPGSNRLGDLAIVVGQDRSHVAKIQGKRYPVVNFFAGKCEFRAKKYKKAHANHLVTAVEELLEETGGHYQIPISVLRNGNPNYHGYAYSGDFAPDKKTPKKGYIVIHVLQDNALSVSAMGRTQKKTCQDLTKPRCWREVNRSYAISVLDLLRLVQKIRYCDEHNLKNRLNDPKEYLVQTRGDGRGNHRVWVKFDKYYILNLARSEISSQFDEIIQKLIKKKLAASGY